MATANLTWHASWDLPLPLTGSSFQGGVLRANPGAIVQGATSETYASLPQDNCTGQPVINTNHGQGVPPATPQSPYLGIASLSYPLPLSGAIPMWVDAFGGDDYRLCDGAYLAGVGDYGQPQPGYPSFDTPPDVVKFAVDQSQWIGQPPHAAPPISVTSGTGANQGKFSFKDVDSSGNVTWSGSVSWNGTITLSSK